MRCVLMVVEAQLFLVGGYFTEAGADSLATLSYEKERISSEVGSRRRLLFGCLEHSECDTTEYCAANYCLAADVQYPCGKCSPCESCVCDSMSVDNHCPDNCGVRRCWTNKLLPFALPLY